jgi:hypothetical protein
MKRMRAAHRKALTLDLPDAEAEINPVHVQAEALVETMPLSPRETDGGSPPVPDRRRRIFLSSAGGWIDCDVYLREAIAPGHNFIGSATHCGIDNDYACSARSNLGDGPGWATHSS